MALGEEARLQISELEALEREHVSLLPLVLVLEPGQALRGQHEPQVLGAAPHYAHAAVQAEEALANDLVARFPLAARASHRRVGILLGTKCFNAFI